MATNETTNATSSADGSYTVPFLRPGLYKVTVTAQGFKQFVRENVTLEVGRIVGIDVTLDVGNVSDSITVEAQAAVLETQTASRVGVVTTTQVAELPLNSRNPFMLGSMMSGVNFRGAAIWQRPFDNGAIAEWSVNGGRQSNNEFLMDGAPNNAQMGSNNIAYVPPVDSVQEFSVQQNSYDAQYGKTGGGVFNVVLKSGTSEHHGTAYEYMRRQWMDANAYQNNAVGTKRPDHRLDQYGFQLDGPVYLPKLLKKDSKVRLFYMGQYEGYWEKWPQFLNNSWPEPEMRTGDFSKLTTAKGAPITIYDPVTTSFDSAGNPIRAPFPENKIPDSRINPIAKEVTKYMPLPNANTPGERYSRLNHQMPTYAAKDLFYNLTLKFDWNFGDNNRAFFRHASNDRTENRCVNGICEGPGMDGQQPFQRINDAYVLDWVSTLGPRTVLNVRASHNRFIEKGLGAKNLDFDITSLGIPESLVRTLPSPVQFGRWNFDSVYSNLGRARDINITNTYNLMGSLTKIMGPHTVKAGVDVRRTHFIYQSTGNILQFDPRTRMTQKVYNSGREDEGDPYAAFLLGLAEGSSNYPLFPFFQQWYGSPFIQDDWKVSRKLTLNLGLRLDFTGFPGEKYNRLNRGFNPDVASPIASQIPADMLALYPNLRNLKGGLEFLGVNGNPTTVAPTDWNNVQPRIGAAYALTGKMVLRGGYGLYYTNFANNNDWNRTNGFSTSTPLVASLDGNRTYIQTLNNPYPNGVNTPVGSSLGYNTWLGQNTNWFDPGMRTPRVHQFSLGIQRQITPNSTIDASFVGSRSVGLSNEKAFNIPSADFQAKCDPLQGGSVAWCNEQLPNPFKGIAGFAGAHFSADKLSRWQLNRPYPQFSGDMLRQGDGSSKIWYNSLQINYNARVGNSLTLLANYTLSKMVERWGYNDPYRDKPQQGLYFFDRPHFLKFSTVWELPFGRGKMFGGSSGPVLNKLIGGWQFSTFSQTSAGEPNNLPSNVIMLKDPRTSGGNWNGKVNWNQHRVWGWNNCVLRMYNDGSVAPRLIGGKVVEGCGGVQDPVTGQWSGLENYVWMQTASYATRNTPYRSGQIRKQWFFNMDASLAKMTQITERVSAQFRLEAFNATNYYFFGRDSNFDTNPQSDNFGSLTPHTAWTGNGYPRQVQLGFKVLW